MIGVTSEPQDWATWAWVVWDSEVHVGKRIPHNDIKWICNAKTTKVEDGKMGVSEMDEMGNSRRNMSRHLVTA